MYAQSCADALATSLNDLGRLGVLARAVLQSHLSKCRPATLSQPAPSWVRTNCHMHLRQAAIILQSDLHIRYNAEATPHQYLP